MSGDFFQGKTTSVSHSAVARQEIDPVLGSALPGHLRCDRLAADRPGAAGI